MATLPERLKNALTRMDQGRFAKAKDKARTLWGMGKEPPIEKKLEMIDRKNELVLLKQQPGWRLVLQRVADRKQQVFEAWVHNAQGNEAELKARVSELEDLLRWVEGEIAAGETADLALQEGEKR